MSKRAEDRRVGRTKRRLKTALLELIEEAGYDAITIRDLTDRADVGRSTFYSHYASKEDLLFDGFDRWVLTVGEADAGSTVGPSSSGPRFRFALPLLRHIGDQKGLFDALMVRSGDVRIRRRITDLLALRVKAELQDMQRFPGLDVDGHAHAVVGTFVGLVAWWLERARGLSPVEVERTFRAATVGVGVMTGAAGVEG